MPSAFYLLSATPLTVLNLDGFAASFVKHDPDTATFRFCLLMCTNDGQNPRNSQLGLLFEDLKLTRIPAPEPLRAFLKESLSRNDAQAAVEVWTFFEFGAESPLGSFNHSEIEFKIDAKTDASVLLITQRSGLVQRPAALEVIDGEVSQKIRTSFSAFGQFYGRRGADGQFMFRMDGSFHTILNLPFSLDKVFPAFKSGLEEILQFELQHDGPGNSIRLNGIEARPSGRPLSLNLDNTFQYADRKLTYCESDTRGFSSFWSTGRELVATNARLTVTAAEMKTESEGGESRIELALSGPVPPLTLLSVVLYVTETDLKFASDSLQIKWDDDQPAIIADDVQVLVDNGGLGILSRDGQTASFTVPWDFTRAAQLVFTGTNLELRYSSNIWEVVATSCNPFDLSIELSLVTKFTEDYDLNFPTERVNATTSPPIQVNARGSYEGTLLTFDPDEPRPVWTKLDLALEPAAAGSRTKTNWDDAPRLTFMDVDLKKLTGLGSPGEFRILDCTLEDGSTVSETKVKVDCRFASTPSSSSQFVIGMIFNLTSMTLKTDDDNQPVPLHFFCRKRLEGDRLPRRGRGNVLKGLPNIAFYGQLLDFGLFSVELPNAEDSFPNENNRHGFVDLSEGELVTRPAGDTIAVLIRTPGGLPPANPNPVEYARGYARWDKQRWLLRPEQFDPDNGDDSLLRIGRKGVTVNAVLERREITLNDTTDDRELIAPITAEPLETSQLGSESRIRIKANKILDGEVFARMLVPGTEDLVGELIARLSQNADGSPDFSAALSVEGEETQCNLRIGYFQAMLTKPRLSVAWKNLRWNIRALADAVLTVQPQIFLQNGMTALRGESAIVVKDVDLFDLSHKKSIRPGNKLALQVRKFEFSVLGLVGLRLDQVSMSWKSDTKEIQFSSEKATITFGSGGGTRGGLSLGDAEVECKDGRVRLKSASGGTVTLSVPGQFDFSGTVSWKDKQEESYFSIQGTISTFGGLSAGGFLRYGRGIKRNGDAVRQLAVFAERKNINYQLLPAAVWQTGGFGGGYNVELGNLSRHPTDAEILAKIDSLEPTIDANWHFVKDNGTYLSLVGKLVFTSQLADQNTICGYVLSIVASVDSEKRILAAGKLWLFSSQNFAEDNRKQPSLVAGMQLDLRRRTITMRAETRRGGAIEAFPQLKAILDQTKASLVLRLTPNLFDIYLERLTYRQQWLGAVEFLFEASWRFSVFRETILQYVRAKVRGNLSHPGLSDSNGGFSFDVNMDANLEYGGIFGRQGVMTWGEISARISASCTAFVEFEFSVPSIKRDKFRVYTEWRTVTKRYEMPRQEVGLGISGEYAFRGSGGISSGARLRISFSRNICGKSLSISPELAINADLLDEVKGHVQHFEAQIDRVAAGTARTTVTRALATSVVHLRSERLLAAAKSVDADTTEEWLVVENSATGSWALLPTWSTEWLTPRFVDAPRETPDFEFKAHVQEIRFNEDGSEIAIVPAWDHQNWGTHVPPQEAEGGMRDLYRLNSLFLESAQELASPEARYSFAERQSLAVNLDGGYTPVIDHRPLQRLRDALTDEDRLTLPADIYPFSYRPGSDPDFENLERALAQAENGANRLGQGISQYQSARGAILAMLVEELDGRGTGLFSESFSDVLDASTVTAYIQRGTFPRTPNVSVKREGSDDLLPVKVIRIGEMTPEDDNVIVVSPDAFVSRIIPCKDCQEFRFKESAATESSPESQSEVIINLPIDFQTLFEAIDGLKTTYFELVDHVRILSKKPGEKDFTCVADRIPLGVGISTQETKLLLKPFIYQEVVAVPNTLDKRTEHYLDGIQYRIQVIPLGWSTRPESEFVRLTRDFETVRPFVPAQRRLRSDLAFIFGSERGMIDANRLTARLVSVSTESDDAVFPVAELETDELDLFYEPKIVGQTGFYGRSLELEAHRLPATPEPGNRRERMNREASGRELSSSVERIQFEEFELKNGRLSIPKLFTAARLFARPAGASPLTPLQEIPVYISRSESEPPISVPHLELLPAADTGDPGRFFIAPVEASEADPRHRVQLEWEHPAIAALGGLEVEVCDAQEKRALFTRRIEVLEENVFREHQLDFSVASEWQLVRPEELRVTQNAPAGTVDVDDLFWESDRWFSDIAGSAVYDLKIELEKFKAGTGDPENYLDALEVFWTEVAQFQSDPQNDDGQDTRANLSNLKYGLIAQIAGMLPSTATQTFTELEAEYVKMRTEIGQLSLRTRLGSSPEDTSDKQLDLVAARQLVALMEYRRSMAQQSIENPDRNPPVPTNQDVLLMRLRERSDIDVANELIGLLAPIYISEKEVTDAGSLADLYVPQLPQGDLERHIFEVWLQLERIPLRPELDALKIRYPLSMWFLERMINLPVEATPWDRFRPGSYTAERLLADPRPQSQIGEVQLFRSAVNGGKPVKSRNVVYCAALQRLLQLTAAELPANFQRFQIRPHHSLGLKRGGENELEKSPISNDLLVYVPQEIADSATPQFSKNLIQIHFASFLNFIERLGFGVDVALVDLQKGTLTQQDLVDKLGDRPGEEGFTYVVCRGRAIDDGAAVSSEVEFSFVKVVALPESLTLSNELLTNRSLSKPVSLDIANIARWFQDSLGVLRSAGREIDFVSRIKVPQHAGASQASLLLKELIFEHHGGAWTTIPAIGQNCRVSLPLPTLDGQDIIVRVRRLSRYVLIDEWRQPLSTSTQQADHLWRKSDIVSFRPFHTAETAPPAPAKPFGFSGPDRIDFVISQPPDAIDSRDNLLTATRTGFKHLGLTFQHRPAEVDALHLVRQNLELAADVFPGELTRTPIAANSRVLTVFPNETVIALRQLPYFMEVALELRSHYDVSNKNAVNHMPSGLDVNESPVYLRRQPSLIATREFQASLVDGWIEIEVSLVQHGDLLTLLEERALPNEWKLKTSPDARDSEDDPSVTQFPDLSCSYFVLFKKNTVPPANGEREPLEPLFEIKLPLCAGYRSLESLVTDGPQPVAYAIARSAQVKVRVPPDGADQASVHVVVRYQPRPVRAYSVVVQARYVGQDIDVDRLVIQTSREGQSQGPPPP